jgi:alkylation response protein AidB-like acyl-CoA dehydrogenase
MNRYQAPLEDIRFVIEDMLQAPAHWASMPVFAELDAPLARQVLEEAARFAGDVLAPLNGPADLEGCALQQGQVKTPTGFREAYAAFVSGGWPALACTPEFGGQGLPQLLNIALYEMLNSANHAWTMYPGLAHGAYECLKAHAPPELRERWLPGIVSGEVLATMCLTEPQAGSDLGLLRTRAEPHEDGSVRVSGSKIFISGGEHDLTDDILHLVLCRLPDAPAGSKGLSLVLVPKRLAGWQANAVHCDGIEMKMGLKGSATCALRFEGAVGWLIGEPHCGLAAMFLMMNAARLQVGVQGLGHLDAARQKAWSYALERRQGRAAGHAASGAAAPSPIAWHAPVRHILWSLQARTDAARLLAYHAALLLDEAEHAPEAARRARSGELLAVLTPVVKAFLTELGHDGANDALQVFGGYGYVHEFGIEQHVRDSRIAMIYEGTNEIQAIDLVTRKLLDGSGRLDLLLADWREEADRCDLHPALAEFAAALREQSDEAEQALGHLAADAQAHPQRASELATDMLHCLGWALFAWAWARQARASLALPHSRHRSTKFDSARYGLQCLLPESLACQQRLRQRHSILPLPS